MTPSQAIPIARIRLDGGTQPRAALNLEVVEDYCEAMQAGAKFPPVVVFSDGTDYWLADGFHRVKAAYAANYDTIECEVRQGALEDARWFSFSANKTNGLRRTNDDKQRAVRAALQHANGTLLSNRQIAVHVGVVETTVRNWRERLTAQIAQSTKRTGRDGRTINITNIGKAPGLRSASAPAAEGPEVRQSDAADADPPTPAPTSARTTRSQRIERVARLTLSFIESTRHLARLIGWLGETAGEFQEAERVLGSVMDAIAAVSAEIERKAMEADPLNRDRLEIQEKQS